MGLAAALVSGVLGGTTTTVVRSVTWRALHDDAGRPRLPFNTRHRRGLGVVLTWAAVVGVLLAVSDILIEQRRASAE